jgi:hypothetical protein
MQVGADITLSFSARETSSEGTQQGSLDHRIEAAIKLLNGTSDGQVDLVFSEERTLSGSGSQEYDLAGVLAAAIGGATLTFVDICAVLLVNADADGDLTIGPAATNGCLSFWADASDRVKCGRAASSSKPSIVFLFDDSGYTVTASTGDKITVTETAGNACTYKIAFLGRTA